MHLQRGSRVAWLERKVAGVWLPATNPLDVTLTRSGQTRAVATLLDHLSTERYHWNACGIHLKYNKVTPAQA